MAESWAFATRFNFPRRRILELDVYEKKRDVWNWFTASTGVYGFLDEFLNMLVKYALRNSGARTDLEVTCSSF